MCNPGLLRKIEHFIEDINNLLREVSPPPPSPPDRELVLELGEDDEMGESTCSYYFVCHSSRCLFWLSDFDLGDIMDGVCGVTKKTHIRESTPVPGTHQTKHMTRPGVTSPVLVGNNHEIAKNLRLTTLGLIGRRSRVTGKFPMIYSRNSVGYCFTPALVRRVQNLM